MGSDVALHIRHRLLYGSTSRIDAEVGLTLTALRSGAYKVKRSSMRWKKEQT